MYITSNVRPVGWDGSGALENHPLPPLLEKVDQTCQQSVILRFRGWNVQWHVLNSVIQHLSTGSDTPAPPHLSTS